MIKTIEEAIERLTPESGYPVAPRSVAMLDDVSGLAETPFRTIGVIASEQVCELWIHAEGPTEFALREIISLACERAGLSVSKQSKGIPVLVAQSKADLPESGMLPEPKPINPEEKPDASEEEENAGGEG